jgi:hypothetical protein
MKQTLSILRCLCLDFFGISVNVHPHVVTLVSMPLSDEYRISGGRHHLNLIQASNNEHLKGR